MASEQGAVGDCDDKNGEQPFCSTDAVLVASSAVADMREGKQGAGEGAGGVATGARVGVDAYTCNSSNPHGGPGEDRHEQRVLDGAVDAGDGAQDGEQQRGEEVGVRGGMVGEARHGRGHAHWGRGLRRGAGHGWG